MVHLEHCQMT